MDGGEGRRGNTLGNLKVTPLGIHKQIPITNTSRTTACIDRIFGEGALERDVKLDGAAMASAGVGGML